MAMSWGLPSRRPPLLPSSPGKPLQGTSCATRRPLGSLQRGKGCEEGGQGRGCQAEEREPACCRPPCQGSQPEAAEQGQPGRSPCSGRSTHCSNCSSVHSKTTHCFSWPPACSTHCGCGFPIPDWTGLSGGQQGELGGAGWSGK